MDLGAAPGSWSQVAADLSYSDPSKQNVVAVDLLKIDPMPGVRIIQGDIYHDQTINEIRSFSLLFDNIICDIAPNTTGHSSTDHLRILDVAENILELSHEFLKPGGNLIVKIFQGGHDLSYINQLRKFFDKVKRFKPLSSRKESPEIYIVALSYTSNKE